MTAEDVIKLYGQENFNKVTQFLMEHCLKDYSESEIMMMVSQLNCNHSAGAVDCCTEATSITDISRTLDSKLH